MDLLDLKQPEDDPMEILMYTKGGVNQRLTRYQVQESFMLMGMRSKDAIVMTQQVYDLYNEYQKKSMKVNGNIVKQSVPWTELQNCIANTLAKLEYTKPHHLLTFRIATEITQRRSSFIVLLGGTSGTGKSTLASLLAARLRLTTVLPTDSIRHVLRTCTSKDKHPELFVSTYQAGDIVTLDEKPIKKHTIPSNGESSILLNDMNGKRVSEKRAFKKRTLKGYKKQADLVLQKLDSILYMFEKRQESIVVEGVHLSMDQMLELVKKHPTCVPFLIFISNEYKHRERFAVRARHMTVDPSENKYIEYFDAIRVIQRHLVSHANDILIPKIDNTNVDRSLATIQSTLVRVIRRMNEGESLYNATTQKMVMLSREYEASMKKAWSSKAMRKAMRPLIKQKVNKRLLLRRMLAEQNSAMRAQMLNDQGLSIGSSLEPEDEEDYSSSDEDARQANNDRIGLLDEDDEEQETVGSLVSGITNLGCSSRASRRGSLLVSSASVPIFEDTAEAKLRRSLTTAMRHRAIWKRSASNYIGADSASVVVEGTNKFDLTSNSNANIIGNPLNSSAPDRIDERPELTFSEMIEELKQNAETTTPSVEVMEMKAKWKSEDRQRSHPDKTKYFHSLSSTDLTGLESSSRANSFHTFDDDQSFKEFTPKKFSIRDFPVKENNANGTSQIDNRNENGDFVLSKSASIHSDALSMPPPTRVRRSKTVPSVSEHMKLSSDDQTYDLNSLSLRNKADLDDIVGHHDEENENFSPASSRLAECLSPLANRSEFSVSSQELDNDNEEYTEAQDKVLK